MRPSAPLWICTTIATASLMVTGGCAESRVPTGPVDLVPDLQRQSITCRAQVAAGMLNCGAPADRAGNGGPQFLIVGGQGTFVELASSNVTYDASTQIFQADVTVQNLIGQALGTPDGVTSTGVRVFFHTGPVDVDTVRDASISIDSPDGYGTFTQTGQPYFQYPEILASGTAPPPAVGAVSQPKTWRFRAPPNIAFWFEVFVDADVAYPDGWIDVASSPTIVDVSQSQTLTAVARDVVGREVSSRTITWASDDPSIASVNPSSGEVTGVAVGATNVCASSDGPDSVGCVAVTVQQVPASVRLTPADFAVIAPSEAASLAFEVTDAYDNPIPSPTVTVTCSDAGVATASGTTVTGVAPGVTDCVFASGAAEDTARVAVVAQKGFAAIVTASTSTYRATCTAGSSIQLPFLFIRSASGDGDLGSVQGTITWDPNVLTYVSSSGAAGGWLWQPLESSVSSGILGYGAIGTGTAATFTLAQITFQCAGQTGTNTNLVHTTTIAADGLGSAITAQIQSVAARVKTQ